MFGLWRNVFDYPMMEPPFKVKPTRELTRAEARREFEWFVAQSPSRRDLLIRAAVAGGVSARKLDYSPDSLVPIWKWAIPNFKEEDPSPKELKQKLNEAPDWVRQLYRAGKVSFAEMSSGSRCLCLDIGFYLAEVMMRQHPEVEWALWTLKTGPYNLAYLRPFDPPLVPMHLVTGCAPSDREDDRSPDLLLQKYHHWKAKLE